jgi:EEF1A lysine methyltransferase 4
VNENVFNSTAYICIFSGNSSLSADMYCDGYTHITNIDFSTPVIEKMTIQHADKPNMTWRVMDIKYMTFPDHTFDKAIDKGTLDALLVDQGSLWDPPEDLRKEIALYIGGVYRVLKEGGKFIYITFGQPHFRRMFLDCHAWKDINVTTLGDSFHYFLYECTK